MTQQLTLAHRRLGADQPSLVIAELGNNHEGSFALLFSGAWYFRRMEQTFADLV